MPPRSHATIREVAARAGVSHQTVSRVINANERVSPETRARVEAVIAELGYTPNAIARSMAHGQSRTIACFSPNLTDYTFASIIEGAETEARQHGYFLISASAPDPETFQTLVDQLVVNRRTDGMLVINPYIDARHTLVPGGVASVYLGAGARRGEVSSVALDERGAGRMATQHLLGLGHRRIALVSGPQYEDCSVDRQAGYCAALQAAGLEPDPALMIEGDWSATSGYLAVQRLLADGRQFTALFAQNDRMAVGCIRALREAGRQVPGDISVIGFDDMPLASYFDPPLTTVRQDTFSIGREAVRLLLAALEETEAPAQQVRLPVDLILRSSTQPVALS